MAISLHKAIEALDDNFKHYINIKDRPELHNICIALKGIAESLQRIEGQLSRK